MGASRTADFERRAALYLRYDAQLCAYTRFFAAAATINIALAKLFAVFPAIRSPLSCNFLKEVGAALEADNLIYAREIGGRSPGIALDQVLVCAEQAKLQRYVHTQQVQRPRQWEATRSELNGLLNDRYAATLFGQWCERSGRLPRVLREVREHVGMKLDFAAESHRVCIGRTLIEYIRRESPTAADEHGGFMAQAQVSEALNS